MVPPQTIIDGFQHEQPDYWLQFGNPWEIERTNVQYPVKFYGHVSVHDEDGRQAFRWNAGEQVTASAYDNPIPGFKTDNTINLRLWASRPDREFDLEAFNTGDYVQARRTVWSTWAGRGARRTCLCRPFSPWRGAVRACLGGGGGGGGGGNKSSTLRTPPRTPPTCRPSWRASVPRRCRPCYTPMTARTRARSCA